jgi:hypothetical protein
MATFDQNINIASLVGTWLRSLFTLLGLLAVIAQLRALLKDFLNDRDERIRNAGGAWASCLESLRRSDSGVVEGLAPSVMPWIRHYCRKRRDIDITACERKLVGGTASWSSLFARLQIRPDELTRMGGQDLGHCGVDGDILISWLKERRSPTAYVAMGLRLCSLLVGFRRQSFMQVSRRAALVTWDTCMSAHWVRSRKLLSSTAL